MIRINESSSSLSPSETACSSESYNQSPTAYTLLHKTTSQPRNPHAHTPSLTFTTPPQTLPQPAVQSPSSAPPTQVSQLLLLHLLL